MTTITIPGFIHAHAAKSYEVAEYQGMVFSFWAWDRISDESLVCSHSLQFDLPDGWDPIPLQVSELERQKAQVTEEFTKKLADISDRLQKLLAITHAPEVA